MDKVYRIISPQQSSGAMDTEKNTDWNKCEICQQVTGEVLKCPADSKRPTGGVGYKTLTDNLLAFKKIKCLPTGMFPWLNESQDIEGTLRSHKAKWHDTCRLKYNKTELQRATKRKESPIENCDVPPNKYTRQRSIPDVAEQCFFCGKPAKASESLHHASTLDLDAHVRQCALQLQDQDLLAKLSAGDLIALEAKHHLQCLVFLYNRVRKMQKKDLLSKTGVTVIIRA